MNRQYTFIFEFRGGTYIRQFLAVDIYNAVNAWALVVDQDMPRLTAEEKQKLANEIKKETPTMLSGMDNVWQMFFLVGKSSCLLTIVLSHINGLSE